jgi:FixJ family two-component response regulator
MDSPLIFVVDDDASVRTAVRRLLMSVRTPVRLFASAEQFLADTPAGTRGCLILDVRLPGMSGLQLQQQLVEQGWNLPLIFISSYDDDDPRDVALRKGAVAYLRKPFDRDQFMTGVLRALGRAAS